MKAINIVINEYLFKIVTQDNLIAEIAKNLEIAMFIYSDIFGQCDRQKKSRIINLQLGNLSKHSKQNPFPKTKWVDSVVFSRNEDMAGFLIYTPAGSFIRTNFQECAAKGEIAKNDRHSFFLLRRWMQIYLLWTSSVRLHAALIQRKGRDSFIFSGKSRVGKTTLSTMLGSTGGFNVFIGDEAFLFLIGDQVYFLSKPDMLGIDRNICPKRPSTIFFLERNESAPKVSPLSKKDTFKRLCFLTEFPPHEDMIQKNKRIAILDKLVRQCDGYLLINGNGLNNSPAQLKRLILNGLRARR